MSKAFDTVDRKTVVEKLELTLDLDELHNRDILINDVKIQTKLVRTYDETSPRYTDTKPP